LKEFFGEKLFRTTIPRNIRVAEAPSHGLPVASYDPRSRGAEAYRDLAMELLERNGRSALGMEPVPTNEEESQEA
jgi:chromosome partitioning protein